MPTELNRIRELSGLQQEAPASGDQALANELSMYFAKLAKEMLQNMQRPNTNDLEYEEFVNIAQAFKGGIQAGLDEVNTSDFEFSSNPFGDFGRSINDGPDEELVKILAKYGYRPGPDGDNDEATIVKQQEESAVQEAPGADINTSTMPSELDRIRELSGLQQEAAVSLKGKESALKAWYNKYSKYTGGNGDPLPFGLIKAYTESGIISDGYEENELAKAEKALGKKEGDWEDQDWQKVYSMTPITQGMEKDLLTATGSKTVDEELLAKVYDVIEDMYPSYDQVLGKKESAVAEAPASGDQALANELSRYFAKLAKEMLQNMQRPNTNDVEYEEFVDIAQAFKGGIQAGLDEVNLSRFEFSSNPFGDFGRSMNDGPDEELVKILAKYGYRPGPDGDNDKATIVKQQEESAVQPEPVLNAVKETSVTSQVDEAIKKATAQLKSFSNFNGLKPYKPKKK
jgi:hypothetical protein